MFPEACLGHVCLRMVGVCRISQYVPSQYWHLLTFRTFTAGSSKNRTRLSTCRAHTFQVVYKQVAQLYQCYTYIKVKQLNIFIYTYTWKILSYIVTPDKQLQLVQVIDYVKIDPLFMGTFRISQSPNRRLKQRDLEDDENVFVNGWAWDQYMDTPWIFSATAFCWAFFFKENEIEQNHRKTNRTLCKKQSVSETWGRAAPTFWPARNELHSIFDAVFAGLVPFWSNLCLFCTRPFMSNSPWPLG